MAKIKIGVVGCGVLGTRHSEIYHSLSDVELVAVYDKNYDIAQSLALRLDSHATKSLDELMELVDAASICTPAVSHHEVSKPLLLAKKHLLIEKPLTTDLTQADELLELAEKQDLVLQTGHIERFNGAINAVKNIVKNPVFIECDRIGFFDPRISDVGVVLDLMIHDIDIALYLINSKVKSINAVGMNILSKTEDFANCHLTFENGTICNFTSSRMAQKRSRKIRIFERDQYISLDYFRQEAQIFTKKSASMSETIYVPLDIRKSNPLEAELQNFISSIKRGNAPRVSGQDGRDALEVALKILDQIKK